MKNEKLLSMKEFLEIMGDHGLWKNRFSFYKYQNEGKLTVPRTPSGRVAIPESMVSEIVSAFSPGGDGQWHYDQ